MKDLQEMLEEDDEVETFNNSSLVRFLTLRNFNMSSLEPSIFLYLAEFFSKLAELAANDSPCFLAQNLTPFTLLNKLG